MTFWMGFALVMGLVFVLVLLSLLVGEFIHFGNDEE